MNVESLKRKFEAMGARLEVGELRPRRWQRLNDLGRFTIDVRMDKRSEFFQLLVRPDATPEFQVLDVQPADRHLLLFSKEVRDPNAGRNGVNRHRFLCGHDERAWFVAAVPGNASSVEEAKEALKPDAVRQSQARHNVKSKNRNKRKNAGFVRQGEWFFVPCPGLIVDDLLVFRNEPLQRGGTPHVAEFLYRRGGTTVFVCPQYPNGLTREQYRRVVREQPRMKNLNWRQMARDPEAYVKGRIRHPQHKTIFLPFWHRVLPNTENQAASSSNVAFLD